MSRERLLTDLQRLGIVVLDTAVLIYHLEDIQPFAELTEAVFGLIAEGKIEARLSTITAAEILVKPFSSGDVERVALCERFLLTLPHTEWVAPDYRIARETAQIRARHRIRTPDAILLATAAVAKAGVLSNDRALKRPRPSPAQVLILGDYA